MATLSLGSWKEKGGVVGVADKGGQRYEVTDERKPPIASLSASLDCLFAAG